MKRKTKIAAVLLAALIAAPAIACMGWLEDTRHVIGGVVCTYRLSDNTLVQIVYRDTYSCPVCLQ